MRPLADFFVLCLLLSFVNLCICSSRKTVVLFKGGETKIPFEENNGTKTILTPRAFRIPAFVGGMVNNKEFLAVICDVRYASYSDWSFIETVTKTSYGEYHTWSDAEIFLKNTRKSRAHSSVGYVTGVMNENKIYVLASSWDKSKRSWTRHGSETGWDPLLVVGTVMNRTDSNSDDVFVKWEEKRSLKGILPKLVNWAPTSQYIGGIGNGVVTRNGTIIFPVQISNNMHQVAASIMYSTDDGLNWKMGGTTPAGPTESSVVEWNDGKLILFTRYDYGYRKAYESDDMGETWKESLMFSRVWGNEPDRRGVGSQGSAITVLVDTEEMLLFSHPLNSDEYYARDTLQLWMSDGQRIMCVGTISEKGKGESSGHSILAHVGDNLYIVLEINPYGNWRPSTDSLKQWDRVIVLSPLAQFFTRAKKTVREWRELDRRLQAKGIPTNGLVGFLSKSNNDTVWPDMYKCVNANVNGATRVDGGFRFAQAPGSGAQWPVQSQGQNQLYAFAEKQFTLAAIVMIHHTDETGQFSLLGASLDSEGNNVHLGLGFTHENRWYAVSNNHRQITNSHVLETDKEYIVALTFASGAASVFVDGVDITDGQINIPGEAAISHFYMGGMGQSSAATGSSCTVKHVTLFNRALERKEIDDLFKVSKDGKVKEPTSTMKPSGESDSVRRDKSRSMANTGSNDGTVMNLSPTAWMCFVYSVLVFLLL